MKNVHLVTNSIMLLVNVSICILYQINIGPLENLILARIRKDNGIIDQDLL